MLTGEYKYLDKSILDFINKTVDKCPDKFDERRFQLWIEINEIETKSNPSAFVNKCFLKELNKGTFIKPEEPEIEFIPATQPFFNAMRENGIKVIPEDTSLIHEAMSYLLNNKILDSDELTKLNHEIIGYILKQEGEHTSRDYVELLMRSNALKGKFVDWVEISNNAAKFRKEWDDLLKEIQDSEEED